MTDEKKEALKSLERKVAELEASAHALGDSISSKDSPLWGVVDDLQTLAASIRRQLKILAEPETPKEGENPK